MHAVYPAFDTVWLPVIWYIHLKYCVNIIMHFDSAYPLYCVTGWPIFIPFFIWNLVGQLE